MTMKPNNSSAERFPHLWRWIVESGRLEIGPCPHTHSFIRVFDEGSMIWKGGRKYPSLDAALADAQDGLLAWKRTQGIVDND